MGYMKNNTIIMSVNETQFCDAVELLDYPKKYYEYRKYWDKACVKL